MDTIRFELNNKQREFLGLEPISEHWDRVMLKGDTYREVSILYFENDTIKRHITSTKDQYKEIQLDELTRERTILLPKTGKGKEKKLTASVLETRTGIGVYCGITNYNGLLIGNYTTQTTFYASRWEYRQNGLKEIGDWVEEFILSSPPDHLSTIELFKKAKRKNVKFKSGDFFRFKISRTEFGFGRILLNIGAIKKKGLIGKEHGLSLIMTMPVLVKIYIYSSDNKNTDIQELRNAPCFPSDYMMDNLLLYGDYKVIGHEELKEHDFEFPISFGQHIDRLRRRLFLQWGLIHVELPLLKELNQYTSADNPFAPKDKPSWPVINPYGYYSIGFYPRFDGLDIKEALQNSGHYDFKGQESYKSHFDLRNPENEKIKTEIMSTFGLDPTKGYEENSRITHTIRVTELLKKLN